jgi:hypothetical protein
MCEHTGAMMGSHAMFRQSSHRCVSRMRASRTLVGVGEGYSGEKGRFASGIGKPFLEDLARDARRERDLADELRRDG